MGPVRARSPVVIVAVTLALAGVVALGAIAARDARGGRAPGRLARAEYSTRVTVILTRLAVDVRTAGSAHGPPGGTAGLRGTKRALDRAAARLAPLRPPADGERDHRALVGATRDYAAQIDLLRASVDFGDTATIAAHLRDVTAPAAMRAAIGRLDARGYRIPIRVVGRGALR